MSKSIFSEAPSLLMNYMLSAFIDILFPSDIDPSLFFTTELMTAIGVLSLFIAEYCIPIEKN